MNTFSKFRVHIAGLVQKMRLKVYRRRGYDIGDNAIIERAVLDKVHPRGVHIGKECLIASGVIILTHDHCKRIGSSIMDCYITDTYIGDRCFVAMNSIIMPGVRIGRECIVGAGSVVTKDVPDHCVVAGNPARIIRKGIKMTKRAEIINWNPQEGFVNTEKLFHGEA